MTTIRPADPAAVGARAAALVAEQRALDAAGELARTGTTLRHRLDEVQTDDPAWRAYSDAASSAAAHLQAELVLAEARLSARRAVDPLEVEQAAAAASHLARQRLEDLVVQAHLGAMDVTTMAERAVAELERVARALRDRSRRLHRDAAGTFEEMRTTAAGAIDDAHRALMVAAAAARSGEISFDGDGRSS